MPTTPADKCLAFHGTKKVMYTAITRPILTYQSLLWGTAKKNKVDQQYEPISDQKDHKQTWNRELILLSLFGRTEAVLWTIT